MKRILYMAISLLCVLCLLPLAQAESAEAPENTEEETMRHMIITVGESELTVRLEDNASVDALLEWLADGSQTIPTSNYGGFEKVCPLGVTLPSDDTQTTTQPGDVMLYSSSQLVIFHGSNAWAYTRIGWIEDLTQEELRDILAGPEAEITLSME